MTLLHPLSSPTTELLEEASFEIQKDIVHTKLNDGKKDKIEVVGEMKQLGNLELSTNNDTTKDSSTSIMNSCMFTFPIPPPRNCTILVEPITEEAARQPQFLTWRPEQLNYFYCRSADASPSAGMNSAPRSETIIEKNTTFHSLPASPKGRKRHRIYLNGRCIDSSRILNTDFNPRIINSVVEGEEEEKGGGGGGKKTFTFVADKRMSSEDPSNRKSLTIDSNIIAAAEVPSPKNKTRKTFKKQLTFHQLEFNSETLKPFDRSVYVVDRKNISSVENYSPPKRKNQSKLIVEAAEILLELRTDENEDSPVEETTSPIPAIPLATATVAQ